jgi:ABC-type Mn2+/Zn2+ transport system permease subunit
VTTSDAARVRAALDGAARDMTTLHVREDVLRNAVAAYPSVADLHVRTDFPHAMSIEVVEHRPVAALDVDGRRVPVSGGGIVLTGVHADRDLPTIRLHAMPPSAHVEDAKTRTALAIAAAAPTPAIGRDTAVAVVVTTLFGAGALLALSPSSPPGLQGLLFGDVLGVSNLDLALAAALAAVVLAALALLHGRLLTVGFDRLSAPGLGVRPLAVDVALLVLLALALLVAVQGLGNLLVVAVLVAPASAARLVARRMAPMMATSAAIAVLAGLGGLYFSYYAGTAAGASIAAVLVGAYLVAGAVARR